MGVVGSRLSPSAPSTTLRCAQDDIRCGTPLPNFLSEWCSSGAGLICCQSGVAVALTRESPDRTYLTYFLFGLLTEASLMRRYHNKLHLTGAVRDNNSIHLRLVTILLVESRLGGSDKVVVEVGFHEVDGAATEAATHDA